MNRGNPDKSSWPSKSTTCLLPVLHNTLLLCLTPALHTSCVSPPPTPLPPHFHPILIIHSSISYSLLNQLPTYRFSDRDWDFSAFHFGYFSYASTWSSFFLVLHWEIWVMFCTVFLSTRYHSPYIFPYKIIASWQPLVINLAFNLTDLWNFQATKKTKKRPPFILIYSGCQICPNRIMHVAALL